MKVRIIQILCPLRHCVMGVCYPTSDGKMCPEPMEMLKAHVQDLIAKGVLNPWCGVCHSREWSYEDAPTIFKTIEEALGPMQACEAEQILSAKRMKPGTN